MAVIIIDLGLNRLLILPIWEEVRAVVSDIDDMVNPICSELADILSLSSEGRYVM